MHVMIPLTCAYWATYLISDNSIGDEGARALAESLIQNMTITELNLRSMSEFSV